MTTKAGFDGLVRQLLEGLFNTDAALISNGLDERKLAVSQGDGWNL